MILATGIVCGVQTPSFSSQLSMFLVVVSDGCLLAFHTALTYGMMRAHFGKGKGMSACWFVLRRLQIPKLVSNECISIAARLSFLDCKHSCIVSFVSSESSSLLQNLWSQLACIQSMIKQRDSLSNKGYEMMRPSSNRRSLPTRNIGESASNVTA